LQLDRSNTETQTKLAMIKDLFGGNAKGSKSPTQLAANTVVKPVIAPSEAVVNVVASSKPVVEPTPSKASARVTAGSSDPLKTVHEWAAAWSSKNAEKYLAFYADNFVTPDGSKRGEWENLRRERIAKPASIRVGIVKPKLHPVDNSHASVSFKQSYQASHLHSTTSKTLLLVKVGGKWLIQEERASK
jgi:Domain of unknown function (DUF4440)